MDRDVLIVGGGPTGMTLALQLHRYGVSFRIIEKRQPGPSPSKALSINPGALHLLNDLDLADSLVALGHRTETANLLYDDRRLVRLRFGRLHSRYPFFLMLPQPDTEAALEARLHALGQSVERDCELVALTEEPRCVRVRLRRGDAIDEEAYRYVVGCDGGRSTVRQSIGLDFRGHDYHMHFLLADVRIRWPGARGEAYYFVRDAGFVILLPLKDGYHRIVVKGEGAPSPGVAPTLEQLRAHIARYRVDGLEIDDPVWLSRAPFYNRCAPTFRRARLFLAGDAAHLFSPIGGFGMNTGIGDAFNLGWKLGYALNGAGTEALLASYDEERRGNAEKLLARTDRSTSLIARLDRHGPADERGFLPLMENRSFIRRAPWDASGLAQAYGRPDAPPLPGTAARRSAALCRRRWTGQGQSHRRRPRRPPAAAGAPARSDTDARGAAFRRGTLADEPRPDPAAVPCRRRRPGLAGRASSARSRSAPAPGLRSRRRRLHTRAPGSVRGVRRPSRSDPSSPASPGSTVRLRLHDAVVAARGLRGARCPHRIRYVRSET